LKCRWRSTRSGLPDAPNHRSGLSLLASAVKDAKSGLERIQHTNRLKILSPRSTANAVDRGPDNFAEIRIDGVDLAAKLKALLRKAAGRSVESLWNGIVVLLDAFPPDECANCSTGYASF
jgi:hypothetical protein